MTQALRHLDLLSPPADHPAESVILGMPHLCLGGVSETWLLKHLGHRHWSMLAAACGRAVPDFRDTGGEAVYAAFNTVSVRDLDLGGAVENQRLDISGGLVRLSETQFRSLHRLFLESRPVGEVEMISVFVKRTEKGRNRSIARVTLSGLPAIDPAADNPLAAIRSGRWDEHLGFRQDEAQTLHRYGIDPCPAQDFNGAHFLYFAAFQGFIDRAEWAFARAVDPLLVTRRRDIVYRGNIEPGETVAVVLQALRCTGYGIRHWCRIERGSDGTVLADVFTERAYQIPVSRS